MNIAIATAADANYYAGLKALLNSLYVHARDVPVYIFDCGLKANQLDELRARGHQIAVPRPLVGPEWGHVTRSTYARFSCCFLPAKKVLYLDADIIVTGFLDELFNYDCPLGMCREDNMPLTTNFHGTEALDFYKISHDAPVLNGGMFLLNVQYWLERFYHDYVQKITRWKSQCRYADQSCLNLMAYEKKEFIYIPKKWNTFHYEIEKYPDFRLVHFHMSQKPWQIDFGHRDSSYLWNVYA